MISVSDKYVQLMKSNIRPKCEPIITVSGIDNEGNNTTLTWSAKDIQGLKFKRGIDVAGREAPFMELQWTELFTGKLNPQNYPEKYKNITKYMKVELSFVQNLEFFATWGSLSKYTWGELSKYTWGQLRNLTEKQIIKMPTMYLSARPVVKGNKIEWSATDLMSFLTQEQIKGFTNANIVNGGIPFVNPLIYLILNARSAFLDTPTIFDALTETASELQNLNINPVSRPDNLDKRILFNAPLKDCLINYASLRNRYWDFAESGSLVMKQYPKEYAAPVTSINPKTMYEYPEITTSSDISNYSFKSYVQEYSENNKYTKNGEIYTLFENSSMGGSTEIYIYRLDSFGEARSATDISASEVNYILSVNSGELEITPMSFNAYDNIIVNQDAIGEAYVEDNPVNPYSNTDERALERFNFLKDYFNKDCASLEWKGLANPALELGDIVTVPTNLYDNNERVEKDAVLVQYEIEYSGGIKEKYIAHEVIL